MSQNGGAVDGARRNGATPRTPKAQQAPSAASTARTAAPTKEPEPGTGVGADASAGTSTGAITGNAGNRPLPPDPQLREEIADLLKDADFTKLTLRQLRGLLVRKGFSQQDVHAQKKTIKAVVLTLLLVERPKSAQHRFGLGFKEQVQAENPGAPVSELVHIITDKWRKASEEERRPFVEAYERELRQRQMSAPLYSVGAAAAPAAPAAPAAAAPKPPSAAVVAFKKLVLFARAAGCGPSVLANMKELSNEAKVVELRARLQRLGHTFSGSLPSEEAIANAKEAKERKAALDGLDTSNIIEGSRRRAAGAPVAAEASAPAAVKRERSNGSGALPTAKKRRQADGSASEGEAELSD